MTRRRRKPTHREDHPRERLLHNGAVSLSDAELVEILLRNGCRGSTAKGIARELLAEFGGLVGLSDCEPAYLHRHGIGGAKAATLVAAFEISRRVARGQMPYRDLLDRPEAVARYLALQYGLRDQETMGALFLDIRNRLIGESEAFRGTQTRTVVEPRAIMKEALLRGATNFILFHTHPSGDPSPSAEDLTFTRRLAEVGELLGIKLRDHLILGGGGRWMSLRRRGAW